MPTKQQLEDLVDALRQELARKEISETKTLRDKQEATERLSGLYASEMEQRKRAERERDEYRKQLEEARIKIARMSGYIDRVREREPYVPENARHMRDVRETTSTQTRVFYPDGRLFTA